MKRSEINLFFAWLSVFMFLIVLTACNSAADRSGLATSSSREALEIFTDALENKFLSGETEAAKEMFEDAIRLDSTFAMALLYRGYTGNDLEQNRSYRRSAFRLAENLPEWEMLFIKAFELYDERDYKGTIEQLTQAELLRPDNKFIPFHKAGIANVLEDHEKAWEYISRSMAIDPEWSPAVDHAAYILFQQDKYDEAKEMYLKAIEMEPENPTYINDLAQTLRAMGDIEGAIEQHERANAIRPTYLAYLFTGHCYAVQDREEEARAAYEKAYELSGFNNQKLFLHFAEAATWLYDGDYENAIKALDRRCEFAEKEAYPAALAPTKAWQSYISLMYGEMDKAMMYLTDALELVNEPGLTDVQRAEQTRNSYLWKANFATFNGDYDTARYNLKTYVDLSRAKDPEFDRYNDQTMLAFIELYEGNYENALVLFLENDDIFQAYWIGLTYEKLGNADKAREYYSSLQDHSLFAIGLAVLKPFAVKRLEGMVS